MVPNEAVEMLGQLHRFFPQVFRWRGRIYEVQGVARCWVVSRRGRSAGSRRFFRVHCAAETVDLYQDLVRGTWHLARVAALPTNAFSRRRAAAWRG